MSRLIVALTVGRRGGRINGIDILYESDGKKAILRVPWQMTLCGTEIHDRNQCPKGAHAGD